MAVMLAAGLTISPAMADEAQAAPKKPYMKTLKLKWNLKKNKAMKFTSRFVSVGKKPMTMTIKNVKVSKAKKKGYKKLTFTVVNKAAWKPTKKQVHKMVKSRLCRETGSTVDRRGLRYRSLLGGTQQTGRYSEVGQKDFHQAY